MPNSRNLELDREVIEKLNEFLKNHPHQVMVDGSKGHYMALCWLRDFLKHFEDDFIIW